MKDEQMDVYDQWVIGRRERRNLSTDDYST